MGPANQRRFTMLDSMALIAATAFGMWFLSRSHELESHYFGTRFAQPNPTLADRLLEALMSLRVLSASLAAFPPILLALRLRKPRPPRRRLFHQPGFVACLAWLIPLLANGVLTSLGQYLNRKYIGPNVDSITNVFSYSWIFFSLTNFQVACQSSVATAWLILALGGRWRPEPSWIDRAGRVLGFYFIAIIPLYILIPYVM